MDYEKYYDTRGDGSYVIHFPNGKGVNLVELNKIFSAFGTVLSVNNRGQICGLCFVRYKHLEDVKRCIDGLRKHQFIKLLPHINKKKPLTKPFKQSSPKVDSRDSSFAATEYQKGQLQQNHKGSKSDSENVSVTSLASSRKSLAAFNHDPPSCSIVMEPHEEFNYCSSISSEATTEDQRKVKCMVGDIEIPNLLTLYEKYCIKHPELSDTSVQIIPSQEVIVANVHFSIGVHYILHLFEKYNPIAVSMMKKTAKAGIRYCHVYFKTDEEAYETVKYFNGICLQGKEMIVLTSQELYKEAF